MSAEAEPFRQGYLAAFFFRFGKKIRVRYLLTDIVHHSVVNKHNKTISFLSNTLNREINGFTGELPENYGSGKELSALSGDSLTDTVLDFKSLFLSG